VANESKDWVLILNILLKDRPNLKILLKKTPNKLVQQCYLDLEAVPADESCLIQRDLAKKIKKTIKNLCELLQPTLIVEKDKKYIQEVKSWVLEKTNEIESYRSFERAVSKTKPKMRVLNDRVAILYALCRHQGLSEKDAVEKIHNCLCQAGIEPKRYDFFKVKKRYLNILNTRLKELSIKINKTKKKRSKKEIIAEVVSELGPL